MGIDYVVRFAEPGQMGAVGDVTLEVYSIPVLKHIRSF
jgi:hypothetical protein